MAMAGKERSDSYYLKVLVAVVSLGFFGLAVCFLYLFTALAELRNEQANIRHFCQTEGKLSSMFEAS